MNWVRVHAHVSNPDTHTIPQFDYQWFCTRENSAVECKEVEIGHDVWIRSGCAWFDKPFLQKDTEVPVDRRLFCLLWVYDEKALHPHCHLHHLVRMRVVHLCTVLTERKFIDIGLARFDLALGQSPDTRSEERRVGKECRSR